MDLSRLGWPDFFKSRPRSKYFILGLPMGQYTSHRKFQPDWLSNFFSRLFLIFLKSLNNSQKSKHSKWVEIETSNLESTPESKNVNLIILDQDYRSLFSNLDLLKSKANISARLLNKQLQFWSKMIKLTFLNSGRLI